MINENIPDLEEAAKKLREIAYSLELAVKYHDEKEPRLIFDYVLADTDDEAIKGAREYVSGLDERGLLNASTSVIGYLRNPEGDLILKSRF
jgi:DNA integrity scanning protein DisA with diadenylate cyclase activity